MSPGVPTCPHLSPFVPVCPHLSPFVPICPRLSPFVPVPFGILPVKGTNGDVSAPPLIYQSSSGYIADITILLVAWYTMAPRIIFNKSCPSQQSNRNQEPRQHSILQRLEDECVLIPN